MNASWTQFYTQLASALGRFGPEELYAKIRDLSSKSPSLAYFHFESRERWRERGEKLDPFSVMAIFNRGQTDAHREEIASMIADLFAISTPAPVCYHGIPFVDPRHSIFNGDSQMWGLYEACMKGPHSSSFVQAYDAARAVSGNALGNLSIALFWVRPDSFMAIDKISEPEIKAVTGLQIPHDKSSGSQYVAFLAELQAESQKRNLSFPDLAYSAWLRAHPDKSC